jgi:hypothetical protein
MAHQWVHNTATALNALEQRKRMGSMKEVFAARDRGDAARDRGDAARDRGDAAEDAPGQD